MLADVEGEEEADQETFDLSELEAEVSVDPESPPVVPRPPAIPFGPRQDPVFPSLPVDGTTAPRVVTEPDTDEAVAFPFARNVFTMVALPWGMSKAAFLSAAFDTDPDVEGSPTRLDRAERQRVAGIAVDFVKNHARRIERDFYIRSPHRHFAVGTVVVSEDHVPTSRLRHAKFQWAITNGEVVELQNVRLPVGHLGLVDRIGRTDFGDQCRGDLNDLPFFLAVLLDLLDTDAPAPLAAIGDIVLSTNSIATVAEIEPFLEAAKVDQMHDLILSRAHGKVNAVHESVRYWSVRDTNEAAFSALSALSGEVVVPNLIRRALTKQAYSWLSLAFIVLAIMTYQFATPFGLDLQPPVTFLRYLLGMFGLFLIGSVVFTHRYWRMDR